MEIGRTKRLHIFPNFLHKKIELFSIGERTFTTTNLRWKNNRSALMVHAVYPTRQIPKSLLSITRLYTAVCCAITKSVWWITNTHTRARITKKCSEIPSLYSVSQQKPIQNMNIAFYELGYCSPRNGSPERKINPELCKPGWIANGRCFNLDLARRSLIR